MATSDKPSLLALRDERARVLELLSEGFARDLLDIDELDRRVELAHRATTVAELTVIVDDLAAPEEMPRAIALAPDAAMAPPRSRRRWAVALMGGVERKGHWIVPEQLNVVTIMGGADLDFRDCRLPPGEVHVRVVALMGGIDIIVPPELAVDCEGIGIFGGFEDAERNPAEALASRTILRISGIAVMGGVSVSVRLPGETAREARKRRKRERKALRDGAERQRAIPQLPGDDG